MGWWEVDRRDRVAVCTFTRPPRNFMSLAAMTELEEKALQAYRDDRPTGL